LQTSFFGNIKSVEFFFWFAFFFSQLTIQQQEQQRNMSTPPPPPPAPVQQSMLNKVFNLFYLLGYGIHFPTIETKHDLILKIPPLVLIELYKYIPQDPNMFFYLFTKNKPTDTLQICLETEFEKQDLSYLPIHKWNNYIKSFERSSNSYHGKHIRTQWLFIDSPHFLDRHKQKFTNDKNNKQMKMDGFYSSVFDDNSSIVVKDQYADGYHSSQNSDNTTATFQEQRFLLLLHEFYLKRDNALLQKLFDYILGSSSHFNTHHITLLLEFISSLYESSGDNNNNNCFEFISRLLNCLLQKTLILQLFSNAGRNSHEHVKAKFIQMLTNMIVKTTKEHESANKYFYCLSQWLINLLAISPNLRQNWIDEIVRIEYARLKQKKNQGMIDHQRKRIWKIILMLMQQPQKEWLLVSVPQWFSKVIISMNQEMFSTSSASINLTE
jgi:hypothetical protein